MHELDKYWTLSQFATHLRVSIQRVKRLLDYLGIEVHQTGGGIFALRSNATTLKKALKDKVIRRGRKKTVN